MFEISVQHVMKYMGTNLIFKDLSFNIYAGERVGIVGANGCGKTTLLKLIAGIISLKRYPGSWSQGYDNGMIAIPREARIAYLDQIPEYPPSFSARDVLMTAFEKVLEIEAKMRDLEERMALPLDPEELNQIMGRYHQYQISFETLDGYGIDEKLSKVCSGLNLNDQLLAQKFSDLSGGEKTRLMLGKILMDTPDVLLLDEPTNHLDMSSVEWLEGYLAQFKGIVIVVSHDRYFLDKVINKVVEVENMAAQTFKGNYSEYVRQKEAQIEQLFEDFKEQQKQIKQMESAIKQLRDWAMRSDNNKFFQRAASIQIKLDKMAKIKKPRKDPKTMRLDLEVGSRSGKEVITVQGLSLAFNQKHLFKEAALSVHYGERVAIVGPNGSGKSTLFKLLLGQLAPDGGRAQVGASVRLAYLPQEVYFACETDTILECYRRDYPVTEGQARNYLAKFMFVGSSVFTQVGKLSGGERIRLKLAMLLAEEVNLLLLDEPTNHLDIGQIEALENALSDYEGTLCFISHDRFFINQIAQRIVAIENFGFKSYEGTYDDYKSARMPLPISEKKVEPSRDTRPRSTSVKPAYDYEGEIARLEGDLSEVLEAMQQAASQYEALYSLDLKRLEIEAAIDALMVAWAKEEG